MIGRSALITLLACAAFADVDVNIDVQVNEAGGGGDGAVDPTEPPPFECPMGEVHCPADHNICVPEDWICIEGCECVPPCPLGEVQCPSDPYSCVPEGWYCDENCYCTACPSGESQCPGAAEGVCTYNSWFCDNYCDCPYCTDEPMDCPCSWYENRCHNDTTLPCHDNWITETNCTADDTTFSCYNTYGQCVHASYTCDGWCDCAENCADECPYACLNETVPCRPGYSNCADVNDQHRPGECLYEYAGSDGIDVDDFPCFGPDNQTTTMIPYDYQPACNDGRCIPIWWFCDGDCDCGTSCEDECISTCATVDLSDEERVALSNKFPKKKNIVSDIADIREQLKGKADALKAASKEKQGSCTRAPMN